MQQVTAVIVLALIVAASAAVDYRQMFAAFKGKYARVYKTEAEEAQRFEYFVANMKRAAELQAANPLATFGMNSFSDLSAAEFKGHHNGEKFYQSRLARDLTQNVWGVTPAQVKSSPKEIDWRTKGAVTPVKNQGQCGSCWAFSTTGGIEGQWFLAGNNLTSLSEQELVSCDTIDSGCNGGLMDNAFTWLLEYRKGEIVTEASYPYVSGGGVAPACDMKNRIVGATIKNYTNLPHNEADMQVWCGANGPISIAVDATSWQTYTGGIMTNCISVQLDHGVLIVGYDLENKPPYWIIKNSWGASWGEQGYIRVEYGTDQCLLTSYPCSSVVEHKGPTPPPPPPSPPTHKPPTPPTPPSPPPPSGDYLIYGSGTGFPKPPTGYRLATLAEIKSDAFIDAYNKGNGIKDDGETMNGLNACCCFNTADGYLVVDGGSPVTYVGPYDASGYDCSDTLVSPVVFGADTGGYIAWDTYWPTLNSSLVSQFSTKPNFDPLYASGCSAGANTWGVFIKGEIPPPPPGPHPPTPTTPAPTAAPKPFIIYGYGQDFPKPPAGYELIDIYTFQSKEFVDYYNKNGLSDWGETMDGCCVFYTYDGYIGIDSKDISFLGPYTAQGTFQCQENLQDPVWFGTDIASGQYPAEYIGKLNSTILSMITAQPTYGSTCYDTVNTWGIYMHKDTQGAQRMRKQGVPHKRSTSPLTNPHAGQHSKKERSHSHNHRGQSATKPRKF